jgi:hypothetical protein
MSYPLLVLALENFKGKINGSEESRKVFGPNAEIFYLTNLKKNNIIKAIETKLQ